MRQDEKPSFKIKIRTCSKSVFCAEDNEYRCSRVPNVSENTLSTRKTERITAGSLDASRRRHFAAITARDSHSRRITVASDCGFPGSGANTMRREADISIQGVRATRGSRTWVNLRSLWFEDRPAAEWAFEREQRRVQEPLVYAITMEDMFA